VLRIAFLGCGFITAVHSWALRPLRHAIQRSYASRDRARADEARRRFSGNASYGDYASAIADPNVDAVVVAVPPRFHLALTLQAAASGQELRRFMGIGRRSLVRDRTGAPRA
jgi:predicted dehydrogenase